MSASAQNNPFALRTVVILVALTVVGFIAYVLLAAYGPDLRPARNGGAHALSNSAVGMSGVVELIKLRGGSVDVVRREADLDGPGLLVVTPLPTTSPEELRELLDRRTDLPTLIVLPKWIVREMANRPAWVEAFGTIPEAFVTRVLGELDVEVVDPGGRGLRTIGGDGVEALFPGPDGGALLAEIGTSSHYVLADPDVINNHGLATAAGAQRALEVLEYVAPPDEPITFDVTLVGLGGSPNLLRLAFEPPFLPLTLCLIAAAALAVLHALRRFGPPLREERAVAFGKRAIAENGAALLRLARRRHRTGERYAMLTRDAVAAATGAPPGLTGEALDAYLDRLDREGEPFSSIAERANAAPDTRRLLAAARDLYHWRRTVTRDHR